MIRIIGVTELQQRFRSVFDQVVKKGESYVLTRGGQPEAMLIPYEQYRRFVEADEAGVLNRFDAAGQRMAEANARHSDAEIEADLREATRRVRSKKRK